MAVSRVCWWLGLSIAMASCATDEPEQSSAESQPVLGGNGNWSNGLTTNGLISNGIWANGNWSNGNWSNGNWSNGNWSNGNWSNGNWSNGNWSNGNWSNGIWSNGNWSNGNWSNGNWSNGIWQSGAWTQNLDALALLRSNPHTGQLLKYIYSCAMPAGATKTLDPGAPPAANVVLEGGIGLAPQWDTDGGECDESCQRWISACVLARTNAYGASVEISMRAPATAPLAIRNALATTVDERTNWNKREGGYYGNLFDMTPQCDGVADTDPECAGIVTFANTPRLFACAGPISNLPAITKRFSSSQGDNGPIAVVGDCLSTTNVADTCSGMDNYTEGALTTCFDKPARDPFTFDPNLDRAAYDEVITVYLKDPLNICGNQVCEQGEEGVCTSDCRPGAWAKSLPYKSGIQGGLYFPFSGTTALGPNDTIVVASNPYFLDVTLGDDFLPYASDGAVLVARYNAGGQYIDNSATRFMSQMSNEILAVGPDGGVAVAGFQSDVKMFQVGKLAPDGSVAFVKDIGNSGQSAFGQIAMDSQGDIIVATHAKGAQTFSPSINFAAGPDVDNYVVKLDGDTGDVIWARHFPQVGSDNVVALRVASDDSILLTSTSSVGMFRKLSKVDGAVLWSHSNAAADIAYSGVASDSVGNVYISGHFKGNHSFGAGCASLDSQPTGHDFFLAKYSPDGVTCHWVIKQGNICPPDAATCNSKYTGGAITFDTSGNVIVGGTLNGTGQVTVHPLAVAFKGAIVDFGAGPFDNYRFQEPFLVSFDANDGDFRWAKQVPAPIFGNFKGLAVNSQNKIVVSGTYSGSIFLDGLFLVNDEPQRTENMNTFIAQTPVPVPDGIPPALGPVTNITLEATSSEGAVGFYLPPTAIDPLTGVASVYCTPRSWSTFPIGTTPVTCTATDPFGQRSSTSFRVIVVDTTAPTMRLPENIVRISAAATVVDYMTTAIDLVDGARPVSCDHGSGSVFPLGVTTVTCTTSDTRGNETQGNFTVTVAPQPPPTITVPSLVTAQATGPSGAAVSFTVTATDFANQPLTPACSPFSGSTFGFGYTNVHCIATDSNGTPSSADFLVRVIDTTGPVLTLPNITAASVNGAPTAVPYSAATAIDAVDGPVALTCTPASGSLFQVGTTAVSCTAHDVRGNYSTGGFTVTTHSWSGILQPINVDGTSVFKLGSTIPVKFQLTGPSAGVTDLVVTLSYAKITEGVPGFLNEAASNSAADTGNTFRYDDGQYMFNLSTRVAHGFTSGAGTYNLTLDFGGFQHTVKIALKP